MMLSLQLDTFSFHAKYKLSIFIKKYLKTEMYISSSRKFKNFY